MRKIFFPGCRIKRACPEASKKLADYVKRRYGLDAAGCCKVDYKLLDEPDSTAVLICNHCIYDLDCITDNKNHEYVLEMIDNDSEFEFPDYKGRKFVLQDCGHGYGDRPVDHIVRSLLKKMNVDYIEQEEDARIPFGSSFEEQEAMIRKNAASFDEEDVIVYCGGCRLHMVQNGKKPVHIIELLFGTC